MSVLISIISISYMGFTLIMLGQIRSYRRQVKDFTDREKESLDQMFKFAGKQGEILARLENLFENRKRQDETIIHQMKEANKILDALSIRFLN